MGCICHDRTVCTCACAFPSPRTHLVLEPSMTSVDAFWRAGALCDAHRLNASAPQRLNASTPQAPLRNTWHRQPEADPPGQSPGPGRRRTDPFAAASTSTRYRPASLILRGGTTRPYHRHRHNPCVFQASPRSNASCIGWHDSRLLVTSHVVTTMAFVVAQETHATRSSQLPT